MPTQEPSARKAAEHRAGPSARGCSLAAGRMRLLLDRMRMYTSIYGSMFVVELSQFLYSARCLAILFPSGGLCGPRETHLLWQTNQEKSG